MSYSDILAKLRKESGRTQADAADFISKRSAKTYTFKNISHWETGVSLPPIEQFLLLCEFYGVRDIQETFRGSRFGLPGFSQLNPLGKSRAREYITMLAQSPVFAEAGAFSAPDARGQAQVETEEEAHARAGSFARADTESQLEGVVVPQRRGFIRLYDIPVAAGLGSFLDSDAYEDLEVDKTVPAEADYAVRISGDSMSPRFVDRQIVFVREQRILEFGDIGIFELDGDAYIKKLGHGELLSLNVSYKPIIIRDYQSFHIFGKVVG